MNINLCVCVCNTELGEETDYYTIEFWLNKRLQNAPHHPHRNGNGNILKTKPLFLVLINQWLFFPVYPRPTKLEGVYWNHLVYSVLSYFIGLQLEITPYLVWNDSAFYDGDHLSQISLSKTNSILCVYYLLCKQGWNLQVLILLWNQDDIIWR